MALPNASRVAQKDLFMRNVLLLSASLGLFSCGSDKPTNGSAAVPTDSTPADAATPTAANCSAANAPTASAVDLESFKFVPACIKVASGATVTFTNKDAADHTITTEDAQAETFDSGTFAGQATFQHVFATPGTIKIRCKLHNSMRVSVVVE